MAIREATIHDYDTLVEFWNNNSGWDVITRKIWEDRFVNAPFGPSVILIVENKLKISAMLVFILFKVRLGQEDVKACRPFAAVVDKTIRRKVSGSLQIVQLIKRGFKTMKHKGTDILIMLPDPRWKRFMNLGIVHWNEFPLFKKMITMDTNPINNTELITKFIDFDNSEINTIWDKIKIQNIYMVSRNQEVLKWKNSHRDYKLIGIYRKEVLLGVASYLEKIQDNQIQICDVLIANPEDQEQCFSQISRFINMEYNHNSDFKKMVILAPENFRKSLINIGYHPDDYNFLFCIKRLNKNISKEALNISKWYLSAND